MYAILGQDHLSSVSDVNKATVIKFVSKVLPVDGCPGHFGYLHY